jgi:methylated-DNA-[protein]-cysteine S-methyltransferase
MKGLDASFEQEESDVIVTAKTQLQEYFAKDRKQFDIPLYMVGTKFQKAVWNELLKIPYGTTISYLKLSKRLENEKATRAVAAATGSNAHSIIIPCHRVIGNNGKIIGYAGGISAKKKLLMLESNNHQPSQLSLFDE